MRIPTLLRKRLTAVILCAAAAACTDAANSTNTVTAMRDSSGVTIVENDLVNATATCAIGEAPTLSIGEEDGDDEYLLHQVQGAVQLSDGRIVLANRGSHELRWYDANGRYLMASGRQGQGPGEFTTPFFVHWLPGDTVYAGDFRPFQFLVFGPDGRWTRSVRPMPLYINTPGTMNVLDDGRLLLSFEERLASQADRGFDLQHIYVVLHDAEGALTDTIARLPNGRWGQTVDDPSSVYMFPLFESFPSMAARDRRIITGHASRTELNVQSTTPGLPLERIVRWNADDLTITPDDIAAEKARLAKQYDNVPADQRTRMLDPLINDRRPVADRFPAFGQLRIGRDGRLWIREFPRPRDTTAHHWIAFTPDGAFDCRLDTPRFSSVYEFGADYALVYDRDSLGVERVQRFEITKR